MPTFTAPDDTRLAYHLCGDGPPVICLPGGPMQDSDYLDDLGGLSARYQLVLLDPRGTGDSEDPLDPDTYRCDHQVADVEALRAHLGLDTVTLLAHSAGTNLAVSYAAAHPDRVERLVLVCPSVYAVGIGVGTDDRRAVVLTRAGEPWYEASADAFERLNSGEGNEGDMSALAPFGYARWDETSIAHQLSCLTGRNDEAAALFAADGAFDQAAIRTALGKLDAPVLLVGGELDVNSPAAVLPAYAALFADATLVVQPGAAHHPWLDDPAAFAATVTAFLG